MLYTKLYDKNCIAQRAIRTKVVYESVYETVYDSEKTETKNAHIIHGDT